MAFTEDRSAFFVTDDFAVAATYNGVTTVNGILDVEYADVIQGEVVGLSSARPIFIYDADDIASPAVGTSLVVGAVTYTVRDVRIDRDIGTLVLETT